jgi:hypothetical protein
MKTVLLVTAGGFAVYWIAAGLATAAYFYFADKAAKTYKSVSSGDPKQIIGSFI